MKKGGVSPSQWVIGVFPRRPGLLAEEQEWGQLGVMQDQLDSNTEFGMRAQMRLTARKEMVKIDCGSRYRASQLRNARPIPGPYQVGDVVMFKRVQETQADADTWHGPAR
eukprot:666538-Karenia_brevis.AAC.1